LLSEKKKKRVRTQREIFIKGRDADLLCGIQACIGGVLGTLTDHTQRLKEDQKLHQDVSAEPRVLHLQIERGVNRSVHTVTNKPVGEEVGCL